MPDDGTEKNFKMSETQGKLNEFTKCLDRDIGKRQRTPKSRVSTSQEGSLGWPGTHYAEQTGLHRRSVYLCLLGAGFQHVLHVC